MMSCKWILSKCQTKTIGKSFTNRFILRGYSIDNTLEETTANKNIYKIAYAQDSVYNGKVMVSESQDVADPMLYWRYLSFGGTPDTCLLQGKVKVRPNGELNFAGRCAYINTMISVALSFLKALQLRDISLPENFHFNNDVSKLLFVGLGAGSLPNFFFRYFPRMCMDVVEIDPIIVRVSVQYFGLPIQKMRIFTKNIKDYLEQDYKDTDIYDIIFLDIFNEFGLPRGIFNDSFMQKLSNMLSQNGLVVANIFCNIKTFNHIISLMKNSFKCIHLFAVEENPHNIIIVAYNSEKPITRERLTEMAQKIAAHYKFDYEFLNVLQFGLIEGKYDM
jgi:hypothetical protein